MIFVMKPGADKQRVDEFAKQWEQKGFATIVSVGTEHTAVCLIGNTASIDMDHAVHTSDIVDYAKRVTEQYRAVSRSVHPDDTVVKVKDAMFDCHHFPVIAGPCSVESEAQVLTVAEAVKKSGAKLLRGGAFKPRSSPYAFQGMQADGLELLKIAREKTGLPIVSEMMNQTQVPLFEDVDVVQIGARNMQNFDLLKAAGAMGKPVLLKRGLASTLEEFLLSAEYLMSAGCKDVILCERWIRTFETMTRNTLDLSVVPILKEKTHLPVIVDPSHGTGIRSLVAPLSRAILAVGADGLMVETHNNPKEALCDGAQSLDLEQFDQLMTDLRKRAVLEGKEM